MAVQTVTLLSLIGWWWWVLPAPYFLDRAGCYGLKGCVTICWGTDLELKKKCEIVQLFGEQSRTKQPNASKQFEIGKQYCGLLASGEQGEGTTQFGVN